MRLNRRTFLRNGALAGTAAALTKFTARGQAPAGAESSPVNQATGAGSSGASIRQQFLSPEKKYRPIARWWWPGNDVTEEELRREIDVLDKAGYGGAEIQAFNKGFDFEGMPEAQQKRVNGFATPPFFEHVATAVDEARKHGMFIDYTFGSGWPFGGGDDITPELASIELRWTHLSVAGPAKFHERVETPQLDDGDPSNPPAWLKGLPDGWAERMRKRTKVVAVVAVRGTDARWEWNLPGGRQRIAAKTGELEAGTQVDLTARLEGDGTLSWDVPEGTWQVFVFSQAPTGQRVNAGAGEGPQFVMDHLSAEAFAAHAKRVGDDAIPYIGKYFGNGLRAVFCDSLEVGANLFWSDDFLAEFKRRRGYDLLPYLPILKVQSYEEPYGVFVDRPVYEMAEIGDAVRHDYRLTVSDLMAERFYGQFNRWAHEHKLLSRTQAHGSPTDVLRIYGEADIPETEDLFAWGGYDFLKMAGSAAHVYGRSIVGSESFVWSNSLYETTPEKVKVAADELLTAGVNAIVYHGFGYIMPEVPAPGWHPFTGRFGEGNYSSQFNELNPLWPYFAPLNDYMARVQYLSQVGKTVAAVALYRNDLAHGADEAPPAPKLNQAVMDAGYNYDHVNADSLLRSTVRDKMLVTQGGAEYHALVLPALDMIDAALAEKMRSWASAGLPILFAEKMPARADGLEENAQRVQAAMGAIRGLPNVFVAADRAGLVTMLNRVAEPNIRFHGEAVPFIQKRIGKMNAYFLRNETDAARHLHAEFAAEGTPELWDPWTGRTATIAGIRRNGSWTAIELDLDSFGSALIVFDPEGGAAASPAKQPGKLQRTEPIGAGGWKLAATGLVPSGKTAEIHRELPMLIDWSLDSELRGFSGRGVYTTTFTVAADAGSRLILDLGNVRDVAEVTVNGKQAATLLLRPYQVDITDFAQTGENTLEIAVTNTLYNAMTLRDPRAFHPGPVENPSGLMSSGLIGPVEMKVMN
jgi:glycosyl hydrolase family 106( putative alpha-L-rhamnosidase)/glycosyl hydrolase family 2